MDTSRVDKKRPSSGQDSQMDGSLKRSRQDSSPRLASAKHVINWSDKHHSTLHSEEQSSSEPVDPMIHEAKITGWHNGQTDQRTSTSSSGLERGELDQVIDKQQLFTNLMNHAPKEIQVNIFEKLDQIPDIMRVYRSFDEGYKILSSIDDKKRQEVIEKLKISNIEEHFNTLKTRNERKEFLGWLNPDQVTALGLCFKSDTNKLRKFLREFDLKQIVEFYKNFKDDREKKEFCRAIPLNDLKKLVNGLDLKYQEMETICEEKENSKEAICQDLRRLERIIEYWKHRDKDTYESLEENYQNKDQELEDLEKWHEEFDRTRKELDLATQKLSTRLDAEYFNALVTGNERKAYVRELEPKQIVYLLEYFVDDPNKQKEICKAMHFEGFKSLANQYNTLKKNFKLHENTKKLIH